jgi:peptidoglycan L-alanyl-D-glutamate endopeptidase CwlK
MTIDTRTPEEIRRDADNERLVRTRVQPHLAGAGVYTGKIDGWGGKGTVEAWDALHPPAKADDSTLGAIAVDRGLVYRMFPHAKRANVDRYLPPVLAALRSAGLGDGAMIAMALGTIAAETAGFVPIDEGRSKYNTDPGRHAFNRYDDRADLGNRGRPDGARYKGRGFIQLTGRENYQEIGRKLGVPLEDQPELANDPEVAARILAAFLKGKEASIRRALTEGDLPRARKLVNGGRHGLDSFRAAWKASEGLLA